jgi:uncharacterized protein YndB with AHSA1/START domain
MHATQETRSITIEERVRSSTQEDSMANTYERSFVVSVPVARAWSAFVEPSEREAWMSPPGRDPIANPDVAFPADGFPEIEFKVEQVEPNRLLRWKQGPHSDPPGWLDVVVTFEEMESGTRISITRSGFGDSEAWTLFGQSTTLGWEESLADLVCYLETGVRALRHHGGTKASLGASMLETEAGVRIAQVAPGGFAAEAGLRPGDLLVRLGGTAIVRRSDVWALERAHGPGAQIDVEYVRDRELMRGEAVLSEPNYTETHGLAGA